jgi:hypothetical protein
MLDWIYTNLGSISQIILYITVFFIVFGYIYFQSNKEHILNNWNEYRMKPYIIPIAGFIKRDVGKSSMESSIKNLGDIIWTLLRKIFHILISPLQFILNIIRKIIGDIGKVIDKIRQQMKIMRNFLISIVMNMMKRIENIIAASIFTFGKINDMTKRQLGIYQNLVYMLQTFAVTLTTFISGTFGKLIDASEVGIWVLPIFTLGAPGIVFPLMAVCFTPNTGILTKSGEKMISSIKIGDIMCDGSVVISKMICINIDNIYSYNGDYVSGSHYVYENNNWIRVCDSVNSKEVEYCGYLYNINTTSNMIYSNHNIFLDYDEYNSRELSEKENQSFLSRLNNIEFKSDIYNLDGNSRYRIGLGCDTIICGKKIANLELGSKLINNDYVLGIVAHSVIETDNVYLLYENYMTEWVKVLYNNIWICVRDHPNAVLVNYDNDKLYSIITNSHTIQLDNGVFIRDFLEF